jgi:hypothetical protein
VIRFDLFLGLAELALFVYCLIDVISSDEGSIRNLPKLAWVAIVVFIPIVGPIAWLAAGRPTTVARRSAYERAMPNYPEYDRPGRAAATSTEDDEAFLRQVRERAEQQRRAYREQRLQREREERGEGDPPA